MENIVKAGIFGVCIGDALGVPVEFRSREQLKRSPVTKMRALGTHHQPAGTWSDDGSLTLCLADSLCNGYNLEDMVLKFYSGTMRKFGHHTEDFRYWNSNFTSHS
ncbi:MAG: hypothetical protein K0R36_3100 [Chryseobacterium sp.]|jgi:ADP-ribosylglycohydrolase|nr:hypothetical protein [Chryseobacterium sp.]